MVSSQNESKKICVTNDLLILINKKLKSLSGIGHFVCSIGFIKEKFMEILKKEFFNIIPIDTRMGRFY